MKKVLLPCRRTFLEMVPVQNAFPLLSVLIQLAECPSRFVARPPHLKPPRSNSTNNQLSMMKTKWRLFLFWQRPGEQEKEAAGCAAGAEACAAFPVLELVKVLTTEAHM